MSTLMLEMPPCVDCGKAWAMPEPEKLLWENRVKLDGAVFPKRCRGCRDRRRKAKSMETLCSTGIAQLLEDYNGGNIDPENMFHRLETVLFDVKALERRIQKLKYEKKQGRTQNLHLQLQSDSQVITGE
jgi:hypothetical protein